MPARIYKSALMVACLLAGAALSITALGNQPLPLYSTSVEFAYGRVLRAQSPNGTASVNLLAPVNENADPKMTATADGRSINLGPLRRSGYVVWRPDSAFAALWDCAYSNRDYVRLVRIRPSLHEVSGFDDMLRRRVLQGMRVPWRDVDHYWPHVVGWTAQGRLLVMVCANATAPGRPPEAGLTGFYRGYLIDVDRERVESELTEQDVEKKFGVRPCGR